MIVDIRALYASEQVSRLANGMSQKIKGNVIGIYSDLSPGGIALLLASIRLGLSVALCHPREPGAVIEQWLLKLGVNNLVSSVSLPSFASTLHHYVTQDLINAVQDHEQHSFDRAHDFTSILRTSGTQAEPKNAVITAKAHFASAKSVNGYFAFGPNAVWALSLPLAHVSGLSIIFRALHSGGSIFIAPDHGHLVRGIKEGLISHCSLVPAQLKRLLEEQVDCRSMSALIVGGDRLDAQDRGHAQARGWPLYECYGMTETASMIAVRTAKAPQKWFILPHAHIKHGDDQELLVRSTSLFAGYLDQKGLKLPLRADGFFESGDIASTLDLEQEQHIWRKNNRIISGGENIQAEEIEVLLEKHPQVSSAVVVGVASARMGQRPIAFIKYRYEEATERVLKAFLKEKLASYKCPDRFLPWPSSLLGSQKKPRRALYEHYHLHYQESGTYP